MKLSENREKTSSQPCNGPVIAKPSCCFSTPELSPGSWWLRTTLQSFSRLRKSFVWSGPNAMPMPRHEPGGSVIIIRTRRAGKLYKARSRLYRSQILQVNTSMRLKKEPLYCPRNERGENSDENDCNYWLWKLSPRSTQCTPLHRFGTVL